MAKKRPASWWIIALAGLFALMAVSTVLYVAFHFSLPGEDTDHVSTANIERLGHIHLPVNAANVRAHLESFQDYSISVRFDLPAVDVGEFLKGTFCAEIKSGEPPPEFQFGIKRDWWQPLKARQFRVARESKGNVCQSILVDESDSTSSIVYVLTFSK